MLKQTLFFFCFIFSLTVNAAPLNSDGATDSSNVNREAYPQTNDIQEAHWYTGYTLTLGAAYKTVYFAVSERGSNITQGTLTNDGQITPSIIVKTPFYYFSDSPSASLGWFVEYGYSSFEVNKQAVGEYLNEIDMGTSVTGKYLYVVPVLFYNWGDAYIKNGRGLSLKLGLGPGLGYLQAKGNIVLTETTNETEDVNFSAFGGAIAIVLDFRANNFLMRVSSNGPSPSHGNRVYSVHEEIFEIGYTFTF